MDGPLLGHFSEISPRSDFAPCGPRAVLAGGDELGKADFVRQLLFAEVIADLLPRDSHLDFFGLVEANELFLPVLGHLVHKDRQAIDPSLFGLHLQQLHIDERLQMVALLFQSFPVALEVLGDFAVERPQLASGDGSVSHPG